ncbi:MAG: hypothetical protein J4G04_01380 [Nitrosopumilaceae archaeon]|nr:hypothetical protein [Nitrosopumilaceae archaeon]
MAIKKDVIKQLQKQFERNIKELSMQEEKINGMIEKCEYDKQESVKRMVRLKTEIVKYKSERKYVVQRKEMLENMMAELNSLSLSGP